MANKYGYNGAGGGKSSHACSASKVGRSASKMRRGTRARRTLAFFPVLLYTGINRLPKSHLSL